MNDKEITPMEIQNSLEEEVKAEIKFKKRNRRAAGRDNAGCADDRLPPRIGEDNPGILEVYFDNTDKDEPEFTIILTLTSIPYITGKYYRGLKAISGQIRPIFKNSSGKQVFRIPHHTEFIQDLRSSELIIKMHYKLSITPNENSYPMEKHKDPNIIHPDEP